MDMKALVENLVASNALGRVINDPRAQFGVPTRQYLGATILPEIQVPLNAYTEEGIRYRSVIANAATRYSPVQKKGGALVGAFKVELGNSDIGSEITSADYDALLRLIDRYSAPVASAAPGGRPDMMSLANGVIFNWVDLALTRPLLEHNEKNRWDAIVDAQATLVGDDGFKEIVAYPNPTGQRVAAGGAWSNNTYDPWADIMAGAEFLAGKGYTVSRMFAPTPVRSKLSLNAKMVARAGHLRVDSANNVVNQAPGRVTLDQLNSLAATDGLPPIELYDLQYLTNLSSGFFLKRNVFVMVASTGRDRLIDLADLQPLPEPNSGIISNTIGYVGVGRAAGQNGPGRVVKVKAIDDSKPPRIEGEAWQTSLPVITDPEAIFVITGIT